MEKKKKEPTIWWDGKEIPVSEFRKKMGIKNGKKEKP